MYTSMMAVITTLPASATLASDSLWCFEPGHDAWVLGNEPYVAIDFSEQMTEYAKPR